MLVSGYDNEIVHQSGGSDERIVGGNCTDALKSRRRQSDIEVNADDRAGELTKKPCQPGPKRRRVGHVFGFFAQNPKLDF